MFYTPHWLSLLLLFLNSYPVCVFRKIDCLRTSECMAASVWRIFCVWCEICPSSPLLVHTLLFCTPVSTIPSGFGRAGLEALSNDRTNLSRLWLETELVISAWDQMVSQPVKSVITPLLSVAVTRGAGLHICCSTQKTCIDSCNLCNQYCNQIVSSSVPSVLFSLLSYWRLQLLTEPSGYTCMNT